MTQPSSNRKIALCISATSYRYGNEHSNAKTQSIEGQPINSVVHSPEEIVAQVREMHESGCQTAMVHVHPMSDDFRPIPGWPVCDAKGTVIEKGWYQDFTDRMRALDPNIYITGASTMLHMEEDIDHLKDAIRPIIEANPSLVRGFATKSQARQLIAACKLPPEQIQDALEGVKYAHQNRNKIREISGLPPCEKLGTEDIVILMAETLVRGQALWAGMDGLPIVSVHTLQAHNKAIKSAEQIKALPSAFADENLQSMGNYDHQIYLTPVLGHLCYKKGLVPEVEIQHPSQIPIIKQYLNRGILRQPLKCGFVIGMAITNSPENVAGKETSGKKMYAGDVMEEVLRELKPASMRMVVVDQVNVPDSLEKSWNLALELARKYPEAVDGLDVGSEYTVRWKGKINQTNVDMAKAATQDIQQHFGELANPQEYRSGFTPKRGWAIGA